MDRMTETEARELLEYIYNKPSYLFLGQAYQRESLNKNSYLDKLYAEAGCSDSIHSWRNLLEDHSDSIDQIYYSDDSTFESPIRWSRLFCTRWNGLDKSGGTMDALDDAGYSGSVLSLD